MLTIKPIEILEGERDTALDAIEGLLEYSFEDFKTIWEDKSIGLSRMFILLGTLKSRGDARAIELWEKFQNSHWKTAKEREGAKNHAFMLKELSKNKEKFIKSAGVYIDEADKKLKIINTFSTDLGDVVIVGVCYTYGGIMKFGGTTALYSRETPELYTEVMGKYKDYKNYI